MEKITHIKIQNFKTLADGAEIIFRDPSVLIGPNNSGKTSVLQALTLWHHGVRRWWAEKKRGGKMGVALNRLEIVQAPVRELRSYFKGADARHSSSKIQITVGIQTTTGIRDCTMIFTYQGPEILYAKPDETTQKDKDLIGIAADLDIKILYPMSGIAKDETYLHLDGSIDALIGQGKTAEVLRNLCYKIIETDSTGERKDWKRAAVLMKQIFQIELDEPRLDTFNGMVELTYRSEQVAARKKITFDIALAGRGQQEMLLLIAYLLTHKNSVLLFDEPDAHLELLRQRQVFSLLRHLAIETNSQIIIATHSEIILRETDDSSLIFLLAGESILTENPQLLQKAIKGSLGTFALEHFYKARSAKHVLYVEGSTDIEMLRSFAFHLNHEKAMAVLEGQLNYYYTTDNFAEPDNLEADLSRSAGSFKRMEAHFSILKSAVPDLKSIGIFDSDGKNRQDVIEDDRASVYWKMYELENYFATPEVLRSFLKKEGHSGIYVEEAIRTVLLDWLFNGNENALRQFEQLGPDLQQETFKNNLANKKASLFVEKVFEKFSELTASPILLRKSDFYRLIEYMPKEGISSEITEKLDLLVKYISPTSFAG